MKEGEHRPMAVLHSDAERVTLYSDGEHVLDGQGLATCSEHGPLDLAHEINRKQCTHMTEPNEARCEGLTVPEFSISEMVGFVLNDRDVRDHAADFDPIVTEVLERVNDDVGEI